MDSQIFEVPGSRRPGQTGSYRSVKHPELRESFSPKVKTLYDLFANGLKISRDRPCLGHRQVVNGVRGGYVWETYREVQHRITNFGSGLMNTINHTLEDPRTRQIPIGIWAVNRPEWTIADLACAAYNLYSVALYDTLGPDTVEYVIQHSELHTVVCSADHIIDLLKLKDKLPNLKAIISMDPLNPDSPSTTSKESAIQAWAKEKGVLVTDFATVEDNGKKNRRSFQLPKPEETACLMYTSGTTGAPKGAILSHRNFVAAVSGTHLDLEANPNDISISFLPLAHIFGRVGDMTAICSGGRIGYFSGDINAIAEDVQVLQPTVMPVVPRLLNRIYAKIVQNTVNAPGVKGAMSRRAVAAKLANLEAGSGNTHPLWDRLIFNKVKMALGGRLRVMVTGSAPIGKDVLQFMRIALLCDIREGYGATETCAATLIQKRNEYTAGNVGVPLMGNEIKLVDVPEMEYLSTDPYPRGEICVRGPSVFVGYLKDEEKTREALDEEGWYHSGDIGQIDARGNFVVIDRKKNIFKLSQGEYIAPEKIENVYAKDGLVAQIYIHGDSLQSSLVAIMVPDPEALQSLVAAKLPRLAAKKLSYRDLCMNPDVNAAILARLTKVGKKAELRGFELARAIFLESDPFTIENDLLTPTLKVKRAQAAKRYAVQINDLYAEIEARPKAKL